MLQRYNIPHEVSIRYVVQMFDEVSGVDLKQKGLEVTKHRSSLDKATRVTSG